MSNKLKEDYMIASAKYETLADIYSDLSSNFNEYVAEIDELQYGNIDNDRAIDRQIDELKRKAKALQEQMLDMSDEMWRAKTEADRLQSEYDKYASFFK